MRLLVALLVALSLGVPTADGKPPSKKKSHKRKKAKKPKEEPKRRRVLVVDDEELAAEYLAEYLEQKGYEVVTAHNGVEALEAFQSSPADAVITDLKMRGMDGQELIRRLREVSPELFIIVTTGYMTIGKDEEIIAEGATDVIKKPISLREISDKLDKAMKA